MTIPIIRSLKYARDLVAEQGDATPITWIRREQLRYHEKLASFPT